MTEYIELGGIVVVVVALARVIELIVNKFIPNKGITGQLDKLTNNDLSHIQTELEKHTSQHDTQTGVLIEIKTILNERK